MRRLVAAHFAPLDDIAWPVTLELRQPLRLYWKYRVISEPIHFPTGTETPFPIIR